MKMTTLVEKFLDEDNILILHGDKFFYGKATIGNIWEKTWAKKSVEEQESIVAQVADLYQNFFSSQKREYYILPKISDAVAGYVSSKYEYIREKDLRLSDLGIKILKEIRLINQVAMQERTKLKKFQCLNNETNKTPYGILLKWVEIVNFHRPEDVCALSN